MLITAISIPVIHNFAIVELLCPTADHAYFWTPEVFMFDMGDSIDSDDSDVGHDEPDDRLPAELWGTKMLLTGRHCIVPVQRLVSRCAFGRYSYMDDGENVDRTVVIPLNRKITA